MTARRIMVTNTAMADERFRRQVIEMLKKRAKREGLVIKRFRFEAVPAPKKPISKWSNYWIEMVLDERPTEED